MARVHLSDEDEREEAEGRERLRVVDRKIRDLRGHRDRLLSEIHRLSDEQKALADERRPKQDAVERANDRYRAVGRELAHVRQRREAARDRLQAALVDVRLARQELPKTRAARPEQIRREMQELELRQQTVALPLTDENALIARLRQMRRELDDAERNQGLIEAHEKRAHDLEEALKARKTELDQLSESLGRLKTERDHAMESMRAHLVDVGQLLAAMRAKATERRGVWEQIESVSRELVGLEREGNRLVAASRSRRQEARRTLGEYTRPTRRTPSAETAYERAAEEQLEELLRRGRVTLGG